MDTAAIVTETTHHLQPLISDLGLILMTAGVAVLLFKKIKQPLVLGYLIAGFLAGNHFDFFPSVTDIKSVEVWAEIGVIFLLFSLGLEFSFKKLMKVGGTASITAVTQIFSMTVIGYLVGQWMDWTKMDSVFLGVILSISSTTIILKTFEELGVKAQNFAGIVIGSLIVQDIVAILMMVLLSTIAVSNQFSGGELMQSVLKLVFFLTIWFVGGIFFIPTLLKKAKHLLSDEMLLIISLALCLMMVILAADVGFSPALGAFIMGSIIAETTQAEHIEHLVKPVKDLFGAVFFVSVGMLIDPQTLYEHTIPVVILSLITIFGQSISSTAGALLSGKPLKESVQTGMSLSQIGEFSFIIASLGMTLHVTSSFLYPIDVAVSAVTTFTTPFMIKLSTPFSEFLANNLPRKWTKNIERYSANTQAIKSVTNWQIVLHAYLLQVVLVSVIIIAVILLSSKFILPLVQEYEYGNTLGAFITLVFLSPFLWALSLRRVAINEVEKLMSERKYRGPMAMMFLFRLLLTTFFIGFLLNIFFSPKIALIALIGATVIYFIFSKKLNAQYHKIEHHFLSNLNARELATPKRSQSDLSPWDGHMAFFDISASSNITGNTLYKLQLRELMGINIASIKRGDIMINIPKKNDRLFPGDEICVIGTDTQVKEFKNYLDQHETEVPDITTEPEIVLRQIELKNESYIGKSIRDSKLREKTSGLVVGIEKKGKRILNPESDVLLEKDDILWIVGNKKLLADLVHN
ncbi:CPA2 family monovalent cation:H+ antiporter-2 [Flavobacterium sp. CG_23.5]|uniref:cation:proton antiporter domain-containing protein n=1 Tax=Flavobacterium sp. CG_23.5 TaxID=2760708 RepID=UPI001AE6168C|nr:cation:proton antiporter [Flavobacterium sp. CG_23.5]MBP2282684.1 CPA2 family monovalent cation:H+ antiporter-2 [Flavobacterium sp. CG_23.5]